MSFINSLIMNKKVLIEVSARHVHLSKDDLEKLFGKNYKLTTIKKLSQPDEFATKETVELVHKENKIENVRIMYPLRDHTQVELSFTDSRKLKINPPIRLSGDLINSASIKIIGPKGFISLDYGVIIAKRHFHCSAQTSKELNLINGDEISIKIKGQRELIFNKVEVRVSDKHKDAIHLDTDEGNAAGIVSPQEYGEII